MANCELDHPERLGKTVVLGYCDIAQAGIRALAGMGASTTPEGAAAGLLETGRETLGFSGMGTAVFDGLAALEVVHYSENDASGGDGNDEPSVTLLKLNTTVAEDLVAPLALSLVDLLAAHRPALDRVIIAAAVQSPKRHQLPREAVTVPQDTVCALSWDGHRGDGESPPPPLPASLSGLPALPLGARLADSFLTTIVRLCRLEELPLTVLARAGYRTTGAAAEVDGTDEAINGLGECLAMAVGLEFSSEKACGARRSKGWKGAGPAQLVPGYI